MTIAPELPGAIDLIRWLAERSIVASIGHTAASYELARSAFDAGARSTTHLFNAMSGIDHRAPGVALAALLDDEAHTELIADGIHVAPPVWQLIARLKPADRLILVSDAVAMAGTTAVRGRIGKLDCEVAGGRVVLAGTTTLAHDARGGFPGRWLDVLLAVSVEFCMVFWSAIALQDWTGVDQSTGIALSATFLVGMAIGRTVSSPVFRSLRTDRNTLIAACTTFLVDGP